MDENSSTLASGPGTALSDVTSDARPDETAGGVAAPTEHRSMSDRALTHPAILTVAAILAGLAAGVATAIALG